MHFTQKTKVKTRKARREFAGMEQFAPASIVHHPEVAEKTAAFNYYLDFVRIDKDCS